MTWAIMRRNSDNMKKLSFVILATIIAISMAYVYTTVSTTKAFGASTNSTLYIHNTVKTAVGMLPASCVRQVPSGSTVYKNGTIILPNGSKILLGGCSPSTPVLVEPNQYLSSGWVEAALTAQFSSITGLTETWSVPQAPTTKTNQLVYLFPGLTTQVGSTNIATSIIQPVIQYGSNGQFGGNYWNMASYFATPGSAVYSMPVNITPGDVIYGNLSLINSQLGEWAITTTDVNNSKSTTLNVYINSPEIVAYAAALEVYNVTNCTLLPASSPTSFTNIKLYNKGQPVNPQWTSLNYTAVPSCRKGAASVDQSKVNLNYKTS